MTTLSLPQIESLTYSEINELVLNLQQRVEELESDKARIDWLEAHADEVAFIRDAKSPRVDLSKRTLRDAIDAAMKVPGGAA